MADTLWLQNGKLIVDSLGSPLLCSTCPCTPVQKYTYIRYLQKVIIGCDGEVQYTFPLQNMGLVTTTKLQTEGWTTVGSDWMNPGNSHLIFQGGASSSGSLATNPFSLNKFSIHTSLYDVNLLYLMGLPSDNFYYYNGSYGESGIWAGIYRTVLSAYSNWLIYGSSNLVIPDNLTTLFSSDTYTALVEGIMELVEQLVAAGTTYIDYTALDGIANEIYNTYYSTEDGYVYNQYLINVAEVQEVLESSLSELAILAPVALLFMDSTAVRNQLVTAAELTLKNLRTYHAAVFSDVYGSPLGLVRYYYDLFAIIDKINRCLTADISAADLQTFLEQELTPYSYYASEALNIATINFNTALAYAVESLKQTMVEQYNYYIEELKLVLGIVYASRCAAFLNIFCDLRPIAILTGLCYVPVYLGQLPGNYTPANTDILWTCSNAASYKEFITTCTAGVQTYQIYPVIPEHYALTESDYYPLYAMTTDTDAAWFTKGELYTTYYNATSNTSVGVFRYMAYTEQTYPQPWSDINLVITQSYSYYSSTDSTEISTDGSYVYGTLVSLTELTLTDIWGISDGDIGSSTPAGQLLDMQNIMLPVYVLCASEDPEYDDPSKIPTKYGSNAKLTITLQAALLTRIKATDPITGLELPWQQGLPGSLFTQFNYAFKGLAFNTLYANSEAVIRVTYGGVTADVSYGQLGSIAGGLTTGTPSMYLIYADKIFVKLNEVSYGLVRRVTRDLNVTIEFTVYMPTSCDLPQLVILTHHDFEIPVLGPNISGLSLGFTWLYEQDTSIGSLLDQKDKVITIKSYPLLTSAAQLLRLLPLELQ